LLPSLLRRFGPSTIPRRAATLSLPNSPYGDPAPSSVRRPKTASQLPCQGILSLWATCSCCPAGQWPARTGVGVVFKDFFFNEKTNQRRAKFFRRKNAAGQAVALQGVPLTLTPQANANDAGQPSESAAGVSLTLAPSIVRLVRPIFGLEGKLPCHF
jgi:hypothetical protein